VTRESADKKVAASPGYLEIIAIALITAVITATIITGIYDMRFSQKIKVVDLKSYIKTQKALLLAGERTEEQWKASLDVLEKTLKNEPANHVVILKEVVLRNADEISVK
jgi:hypothetical protein